MIKAAIIGAGFIGPAHLEAIRRLGDVDVVAICDASLEEAQKKAQQLNIPFAYADVAELLQHPGLQVVHNCTPNHLHASINRQVMLAGKHIFSEKPLCMTSVEARELLALANEKGVINGVSFVYRQFAMVQQAASLVRSGSTGRVFATHGSYLQDWMVQQTDFNWRTDAKIGGISRAVADIGSHWCDTVQFVTGQLITEVMADFAIVWPVRHAPRQQQATFGTSGTAEYDEKPIDTEDYANVLLRFADGSRGSLTVSQVSAGRKNRLYFELNGSDHSVAWDQEVPQQLWLGYRAKPNAMLSDDPSLMSPDVAASAHFPGGHIEGWPDAFRNMLSRFYGAVRNGSSGGDSYATFREGAQIMLVIEAMIQSHREQRWVKVAPL
ncbi:Gfo/Idh/MocA family oxidoreductase [Pantoea sp.]|uniref:Gfo/Idh/MocA family protein n=1 Tax=Pantoea sp. TaxID=69393 RepID=UPI0028ACDD14|nr:Gfo/Idh/MocA family oxidoreductase [Pantoea sp.]